MPLPAESHDRRRLLRVWATISTPLLFVFIAVLVVSDGPSLVASSVLGVVVVLGIEALTRGHLPAYVLRVAVGLVLVAAVGLLVFGLLASWRTVVVGMLVATAVVLFVANLRELRRN